MPLTDKQIKNLKQKQRPNAILTAGHVYEVAPSRLQNGDCNIGLMALKKLTLIFHIFGFLLFQLKKIKLT